MIELMGQLSIKCSCGNEIFTSNVRCGGAIVYYCDQCDKIFYRSNEMLFPIADPKLRKHFEDSNLLIWNST